MRFEIQMKTKSVKTSGNHFFAIASSMLSRTTLSRMPV